MASGQNAGRVTTCRMLSLKPICVSASAACSAGEGQPRSVGRSRTTRQISAASSAVTRPTSTNERRQPIQVLTRANGVAAAREPTPPMAISTPVMMMNSRTLYHSAKILRVQTNRVETPRPTRIRPTTAPDGDDAKPSSTEPILATQRNSVMVLRGPQESESSPVGSCMSAYG